MRNKLVGIGIIIIQVFVIDVLAANAYNNTQTHPFMTEIAVKKGSSLDEYFTNNLGVNNVQDVIYPYEKAGKTELNTVLKLLRDGSDWEDVPICRASNHFHNPLMSLDKAHRGELI